MSGFITIFYEVLLPIFIMILAGYVLQKIFHLDLKPLTKVQLYLFIPSLIFIKIATSQLDDGLVFQIFWFTVILFVVLMVLSYGAAKVFKMDRKKEKALMNAVILRNQGNFGIPLITLTFIAIDSEYALSIHMIVLFATNLLLNTIGLYNASSGSYTKMDAIKQVLKLPNLYVIILGFMFKGFNWSIPAPIESTIGIMGAAVVPLALFTLGAQLANTKLKLSDKSLPVAAILRLIISPVIAYGMALLFGFEGVIAQVLIIGAAAPTAVNSVLLAMEFDGDYEYASETVFLTTLLCGITVSITINLVMSIF